MSACFQPIIALPGATIRIAGGGLLEKKVSGKVGELRSLTQQFRAVLFRWNPRRNQLVYIQLFSRRTKLLTVIFESVGRLQMNRVADQNARDHEHAEDEDGLLEPGSLRPTHCKKKRRCFSLIASSSFSITCSMSSQTLRFSLIA